MKTKIFLLFSLFMLVLSGCSQNADSNVPNILTQGEIEALKITLEDEYKAEMTYRKILEDFGEDTKPFSNIMNAEIRHSTKLIELFNKYGLEVPENDWYEKVPSFNSVEEVCQAGVQAEIDNAALYDSLFEKVEKEDIIFVFTNLRDASINNHLPAFERCS